MSVACALVNQAADRTLIEKKSDKASWKIVKLPH